MRKSTKWIQIVLFSLLGVTLLVHLIFALFPEWTELLYGQLLWPFWRSIFSTLIVPLPFNILYFIFLMAGIGLFIVFRQALFRRSIRQFSIHLLLYFGLLYMGFQWCWGYNYLRPSLEQRMAWTNQKLPVESVKADLIQWTEQLEIARAGLGSIESSEIRPEQISRWTQQLDQSLSQEVLPQLGYHRFSSAFYVRQLLPQGILLRLGTAGFYFPYSGEGQIDRALHPLQKPFTIAHELGHAAGITGEGDCNLVGGLACLNSDDPFIRYSGRLALWRYIASEVKRTDPEWYDDYYDSLNEQILKDIEAIRERMRAYPDLFPKLRDRIYDTYLRAQGVEGGMANYSIVVRMLHKTIHQYPELLGNE